VTTTVKMNERDVPAVRRINDTAAPPINSHQCFVGFAGPCARDPEASRPLCFRSSACMVAHCTTAKLEFQPAASCAGSFKHHASCEVHLSCRRDEQFKVSSSSQCVALRGAQIEVHCIKHGNISSRALQARGRDREQETRPLVPPIKAAMDSAGKTNFSRRYSVGSEGSSRISTRCFLICSDLKALAIPPTNLPVRQLRRCSRATIRGHFSTRSHVDHRARG
jgi:hypothetical protein